MGMHTIIVDTDGEIRFIDHDELAELRNAICDVTIARASNVEPEKVDGQIRWFADLAPVNGPKLGPFINRSEALDAEIKWLIANQIPKPTQPTAD